MHEGAIAQAIAPKAGARLVASVVSIQFEFVSILFLFPSNHSSLLTQAVRSRLRIQLEILQSSDIELCQLHSINFCFEFPILLANS